MLSPKLLCCGDKKGGGLTPKIVTFLANWRFICHGGTPSFVLRP
jgi:hypothetical protein